MKMLLTGATGFVGSVVYQQHDSYCTCTCVIRKGAKHNFSDFFEIDTISSSTNWEGAFESGIDSIIHLAGLAHKNTYTDDEYFKVNTEGTINLASQAVKAGVKRFVFVSTIGVNEISTNQLPFSITTELNPHNAYAQSKYDAEVGLKKIAEETGLEVVIVRPTLVYGYNAPGNFGSLTKLVQKVPFLPFGLTDNKRDFIAVQNLADLLITCAKHPDAAGHTFLASDGETVSIKEFTNAIAKGLDKKIVQLPIPVNLMRLGSKLIGRSAMAEQLLGNLEVDYSNAQEILGWTPPYTMEQEMASLSETKK